MKKLFYTLLVGIIVSSCGSDDDANADFVVGVWSSSLIEFSGCDGDNLPLTCDFLCISLKLEADGSFVKVDSREAGNEFTREGTYTVSDSDIVFCETNGSCIREAFVVTSNSLILTFTDDEDCTSIETYAKS